MSFRIMREGREERERMRERGGDMTKVKRFFKEMHAMLDDFEECLDGPEGSYGERDDYRERDDYGERRRR